MAGTRAQGDGDGSAVSARLHAVGVVGGVAVGGLTWCAAWGCGDLPVAVPWVAVNLAKIVPDSAVVMVGVFVLHQVAAEVAALRQLDRPSVAIGKLSVRLGVGSTGCEHLIDGVVATTRGWGVAQVHCVAACVLDNGAARAGEGTSGQKGHTSKDSIHRD